MSQNTPLNNIRALRLTAGFTQEALAKKARVSVIAIRKWEDGTRVPRPKYRLKLARALKCSVEELRLNEPINNRTEGT